MIIRTGIDIIDIRRIEKTINKYIPNTLQTIVKTLLITKVRIGKQPSIKVK